MAKNKSVFINRATIENSILYFGREKWTQFEATSLKKVGNAYRCNITADGKEALLDFYYKKDGSTTIKPTGKNIEISTAVKTFLLEEETTYDNPTKCRISSFKDLSKESKLSLIEYLSTDLNGVSVEKKTLPILDHYLFKSVVGDRLTINIYQNGTLTLQGKPAYLYGEALSLLSYCPDVSIDDIVNTVNVSHDVDIKVSDVRAELKSLFPYAYGNVDDTVFKLLSPSISLRRVNIPLEDYSCYAFPALRALEGYIKYLFGEKNVRVGNSFVKVFSEDALEPEIAIKIGDPVYQTELEKLYSYFRSNRHVLCHAGQALVGTTTLEDKKEADEIVNSVLNLIETSSFALFSLHV